MAAPKRKLELFGGAVGEAEDLLRAATVFAGGNCALRAPMAESIMCHVGASLIHSKAGPIAVPAPSEATHDCEQQPCTVH